MFDWETIYCHAYRIMFEFFIFKIVDRPTNNYTQKKHYQSQGQQRDGRKLSGSIDVIGSTPRDSRRTSNSEDFNAPNPGNL